MGGHPLALQSFNIEQMATYPGLHRNGSNHDQNDALHSKKPVFLEEYMAHVHFTSVAHIAQYSDANHCKLLQRSFVSTSHALLSHGPKDFRDFTKGYPYIPVESVLKC